MRFDDDRLGRTSHHAATDRIVLERGGRRLAVRLPRHGVLACFVLMLALAGWSVASAAYVIFHDTVVTEIRHGAKASARGYEAQIAAMRDELERSRTRRMVENTRLDERLAELGLRQSLMEKRQSRLTALAGAGDSDVDSGIADAAALSYSSKPTPLDGAGGAFDSIEPRLGAALDASSRIRAATRQAERVAIALDAAETRQSRALDGIAAKNRDRRRTLERVYDAAGVPRPSPGLDGKGRGGPFEPLPESALTFDDRIDQLAAEHSAIGVFERGLDRIPLRTPAAGASLSSGFGARVDPFLGRPAFHAGLDFEVGYGAPVKATAIGRVIAAGPSGGYGNMVEIDHGGGLTTRFGHLSAILASVGEEVRIGSVIGRVGSTGRSTGPHLHYETRVDGQAINPLRFLNAGRLLVAAK